MRESPVLKVLLRSLSQTTVSPASQTLLMVLSINLIFGSVFRTEPVAGVIPATIGSTFDELGSYTLLRLVSYTTVSPLSQILLLLVSLSLRCESVKTAWPVAGLAAPVTTAPALNVKPVVTVPVTVISV